MEGRPSRGGGWKRGGRAASGGGGGGGGRGGHHHRGRGRRDHHRGRGRGGGGPAADFYPRDEGHNLEEDDDGTDVFSRRKLESNWDRYAESERREAEDDAPAQRGTDFHVLLESAGDSFTQFRFSDEKDWATDSVTQMSAVLLDLPALARTLQQVPLQQRLDLEAELFQVSTPVELPGVTLAPKRDKPKPATFSAPAPETPAVQEAPGDDEELNRLLTLQKPAAGSPVEAAPHTACDETEAEEVKDAAAPKSSGVRQEVSEEELEDWLDSMIS